MRILIASPVPIDTIGGPATVARELRAAYMRSGDAVHVITFSSFERRLPFGLRQVVLAIRAFPQCVWAQSILLLDPGSTGPAVVFAAELAVRRCVLRVGGDFLWESYVERTGTPILLSEFYTAPRSFSLRERLIRAATKFTLARVQSVVFTTEWQRLLWEQPYGLAPKKTSVIAPVLPARDITPAEGKVFLCAGRLTRVKNSAVLREAWEMVAQQHPDAVLDMTPRSPDAYEVALRSCYAVIIPSVSDVSPNALFEAIRFGKPFICTRDSGSYDELHDLGLFIDTRDAKALADAVRALLDTETYTTAVEHLRSFGTVRTWDDIASYFAHVLMPQKQS